MKAEKFSESLNNINDKYIEESINYTAAPIPMKDSAPKGLKVWRGIAIAACALLAVGVGVMGIGAFSDHLRSGSRSADSVPYEAPADEKILSDSETFYSNGAMAGAGDYDAVQESGGLSEETINGAGVNIKNSAAGSFQANNDSKIIYTAYMQISTTDFDNSGDLIKSITEKHGGYFESMDIGNFSSSYRNASYVVRIPAEEMDAFLEEAKEAGTVTSLSKSAVDVSDSYQDIESRLETAKTKLKRLQELLSEAADMSDIITIEESITDVEWEIDDLSGMLKNYDSQISYSTVSINLEEVYKITEEDAPLTFGERIAQSFTNGLQGFADAMEEMLVWLAANWLWVLLIVVVLGAAIIIIVKAERKKK